MMSEKTLEPESLILVAVMPQPRDLEIARVLGWYRIPLRSAPRVICVDYLAFYQTAAFGEARWQVQYVAPVRGYELTTRAELLQDEGDHPNAAQEYYKVQLGPLTRLPEPILAEKWRRVTFFYTTGELLLAAHTLQDLIVPSDERRVLWQALRERASQTQTYQVEELPFGQMDAELLAVLLGIHKLDADYLTGKRPEGGISG
jgi:hypothetical protein